MLWLALRFPRLPLEAHRAGATAGAVVVQQGRVLVVDEVAAAAGLMSGMRLSTARGMLPELSVVEREPAREAAALDELACFAGSFTPVVCVEACEALLLEVEGCRRLFGGLGNIVDGLRTGCLERGVSVDWGVAPTPLAALWLARGHEALAGGVHPAAHRDASIGADQVRNSACCLTREALSEMLAPLPLAVLGADGPTLQRLAAFGLRKLGGLFALPRAGLARRVGIDLVEELARALGEVPDPRAPFIFPEHFELAIELPGPATEAAMLAFPAQRLLGDFCGWLNARQAGAAACTLRFTPEQRGLPAQQLELRLASPSRDGARFLRILRERLERFSLAAPIGRLALVCDDVLPLPGNTPSLLSVRQLESPLEVLVERLRARLGDAAVHAIAPVAEYRPECASRAAPVGYASEVGRSSPSHPLCLLERSEDLPEIRGQPHRQGEALELLAGPERIEAGWWDSGEENAVGDVRRDYFIARSKNRECLWIYRDAAGWHAQGVFC
jgi:protein ImuB